MRCPWQNVSAWNPEHYRHAAHSPEAKLPEDDLVFFLLDTVPKLDLRRFYAPYEEETRGAPPFDPKMMVCLLLYAYCVGRLRVAKLPRPVSATWRSSPSWARSGRIFAPSAIFASCTWRPFATCLCRCCGSRRVGAGEVGQCIDRWDETSGQRVSAQSHELRVYEERSRAVARRH